MTGQQEPGMDATRQESTRRDAGRSVARQEPWSTGPNGILHPREILRRLFDPLDRGPLAPMLGPWSPPFTTRHNGLEGWAPQLETFQRGDEFVVRADLPGLERKDITVDIQDDSLVIQGERSNEHEGREDGHYASERSYGAFCRIVALPEGAIADSVKASFKNGVLEVVAKAPPHEVSSGRRVEVS